MTERGARCLAVLLATAAPLCLSAQSPSAPQFAILNPADKAYVNGPTLLHALLDPPDAASAVVFFVDGRQICVVTEAPFECDWDAGRSIVEHQIRVVATLVGGGRLVQNVRTKGLGFVENVDVDVVQVTVSVTDGHGRFVRGLPESSFRVFEDEHPQKISHFVSENVPLELIVAVDISGSMTAAMPKLKAAVKEFLEAVPSGNQVTLLGFNDTVFTLTRRATSAGERLKAVDRLAPWGSTALYDVIIRSADMLGRQTGRKAIVLFTDGEDQGSHATIADVERRLQSSDVTLYMIGQGSGVSRETLKTVMERLANPTGGRALFTESVNELRGAFARLLDELSNQYLLGYPRVDQHRDDNWHRLRVDVEGHQEIRARQGFRIGPGR